MSVTFVRPDQNFADTPRLPGDGGILHNVRSTYTDAHGNTAVLTMTTASPRRAAAMNEVLHARPENTTPFAERPTVAESVAKLAALGDPEAVALHLSSVGIKAVPGCASYCALAEYFTRETGQPVSVGSGMVDAGMVTSWVGVGVGSTAALPPVLRVFINGFDNFRYPELIVDSLAKDRYV